MKKILTVLLVLAMAALTVVNCFAAEVSTAVTDLDLIFFEDFEDKTKHDYEGIWEDNYTAEIENGQLYLMSMHGKSKYTSYELPGSEALSGVEKLTAAYSFVVETAADLSNINFAFGGTDSENFFMAGPSLGNASGAQYYYGPIVEGMNKASNPLNNGEKEYTRYYAYFYKDADCTQPWRFESAPVTYTVVVELEKGAEPVMTFYADGQPIEHYVGPNKGTLTTKNDYLFTTDETYTLDGNIGFCVSRGVGVLFNAIAVYDQTGLDHRELIAKVSASGAGSSDTPADTEAPADVTEAPVDVTEAPADVTEAPADVTEAPADVTEAPADDVTEAPADDVTKAPADDTKAPAGDKGCGGVIGVGAIVAILGCAVVLKKRD